MREHALTPREIQLLEEATEILDMAKDLQSRGDIDTALEFALAANLRLAAIRALQRATDALEGLHART